MARRKIHILCSPVLASIVFFITFALIGFYIFTLAFEPCRIGLLKRIPLLIMWTIVAGVLPLITIMFIYGRKYFSIITIDDTGISRSFLGRFYKLHIPWDDMAEAYYFTAIAQFVTFSKTKKVSTMTYNKMRLEKDAIEMTLSKKRYAVIKQYLQQPIVGMPEHVKARIEKYTADNGYSKDEKLN